MAHREVEREIMQQDFTEAGKEEGGRGERRQVRNVRLWDCC